MASEKVSPVATGPLFSDTFRPTTSCYTRRYDDKKPVASENRVVSAGLFSFRREQEPEYLPHGWSRETHPEGQAYFVYQLTPSIVTDVDLYSPAMQKRMALCIKMIQQHVIDLDIRLPETAEIHLDFDDDEECWRYYLVDHQAHISFWLEEIPTDLMDIPESVSQSHLRLALEELYWNHIEYFSHARPGHLKLKADELTSIFLHGRLDGLTSQFSTFPYNPAQCSQHIQTLRSSQHCIDSPYSICVIARFWSIIARHRFMSHYGEKSARLSRDQYVVDTRPTRSWVFPLASRLLFGIPNGYARQLDLLWVDKMVYEYKWREAMVACCDEWKMSASWALALMIINALLMLSPCGSPVIGCVSMVLCQIAILCAISLLVRLHGATTFTASEAATFLADACSERTGFETTAVVHSIPKAFFMWALGVSSLQSLVWLRDATNSYLVAAIVGFILVCCGLLRGIPAVRRWWEKSSVFSGLRCGCEELGAEYLPV